MAHVVLALPLRDFDPTEAAVPWRRCVEAGHRVTFATEDGSEAACDPLMLEGVLLGLVKALPGHAADYQAMVSAGGFDEPTPFDEVDVDAVDALVLPGGHAPGMRPYLESEALQRLVGALVARGTLVAAICHGGVVLARSPLPEGEGSVLRGRSVTSLPKRFEVGAWALTKPTRGDYFRTYPTWVEDEVRAALGPDGHFAGGPFLPLHGDGFCVVDGSLITARWPGDAERFAGALVEALGAS